MKWKDTGGVEDPNPEETENDASKDPYYEDDGYAHFKEKGLRPSGILSGNPIHYLYWGLGIAVVIGVVLLVILIFSYSGEQAGAARIDALEQRLAKIEHQLEKVDGVDEKVTHIWEQAKDFETFKTRFDRSEASTSLRMDHLAMSLDALQKKIDTASRKVNQLAQVPTSRPPAKPSATVRSTTKKTAAAAKTHTVVAGDTLYSISRKYDLTVDQIRSLNKLKKENVIHVGQKLVVSQP
ncbi:putative MltD1 [Desulfosarcina cetonica]|nr:putative MltD1 [Desulfosarcina cetonica]